MVIYAQSTITVISGHKTGKKERKKEREREREFELENFILQGL